MSNPKKTALLKLALVSTIFLSGCSANHYSIYRAEQIKPDQSTVISVDAKQRFLLSSVITETTKEIPAQPAIPAASAVAATSEKPATPATEGKPATPGIPETTKKSLRYCAEPSPDVFSVLSQAASGGGSFGKSADPKSVSLALQAAFSSSETGSTISRTQTINMLKEMMYRTCERYLNGQIGELEYPIIAARDQRIMTSILAIEQLTGTVLPNPVVIAATGSASTGQSTNDAILSLDNANKEVAKNKGASDTAQKDFDAADQPEGSCKTLMDKKDGEVTDETDLAKLKKCSEMQDNLDVANKELKASEAHYDRLANLANKPGVSSATTNALLLSQKTGPDAAIEQTKSETIKAVANVVKEIVLKSFNQDDETSFFCYRALKDEGVHPDVSAACLKFVTTKLNAHTAEVANEAARLQLETVEALDQMDEMKKQPLKQFWDKIKKDSVTVDSDKLKARIDKNFPIKLPPPLQAKLDAMKKSTTKDEISKVFNMLQPWEINDLLKD